MNRLFIKARTLLRIGLDPTQVVKLVWQNLYESLHPDVPWITKEATQFCAQHMQSGDSLFEWGSGSSTVWYSARVNSVTSIEYSFEWYEKVTKDLKAKDLINIDLKYVPVEHSLEEPTYPHYDPLPKYVAAIHKCPLESLNWVIVDGHYRQACVKEACPRIAKGGYLMIDNFDRLDIRDWGLPPYMSEVHRSQNIRTTTAIFKKSGISSEKPSSPD